MLVRAQISKLLLLTIIIGLVPGCLRQPDPQLAFDRAWQTFQNGDLIRAQEEARKGYNEFHSVSPDWSWRFTILTARVLRRRGLQDEALTLLTSESAPVPHGELAVKRLWLQGVLHTSLYSFHEAELEFANADQLCTGSNYPSCEDLPSARGALDMKRGHYADAQVFFERALVRARRSRDPLAEANALLDLSWSADEQTHFDEALEWANTARQIAVSQRFASLAQRALGNMGWAYYKLGDPEKAEGMFIEAKNQAEKFGEVASEVGWLTDAGYIYLDTARFSLAEQSFKHSLALARNREDIITALQALAFVSEQTGKLDDAKRYADEALAKAREDNNGRDQVYPLLVQGRVAARLHDATTAENAFHQVTQSPDCPVFLKWEAERALAHLYEDESQFDSADGEYRTALTTFETARSELQHEDSRLPFLTNATRIYDDYIHFLVARGKTNDALRVANYSRARTLAEGLGLLKNGLLKNGLLKNGLPKNASAKNASSQNRTGSPAFAPDPLDAQQIARRAGGTILFYWLGEKQSYLWAITPQKTSLFTLPPESEIKASVQRYRKALVVPQDVLGTAAADGAALYRMLIAPAQDVIKQNTIKQDSAAKDAKVFIIPDGTLNSLNFETLIVPDLVPNPVANPQPHYWIEDANITNAPSLRMLGASRPGNNNIAGSLLLIGDPLPASADFPQLRNAALEMEDIQKHFPPTAQQVFRGDRANPPAYLSGQPERFSVIHFVAHGTASRLSPLDSAIILSKATAEDDSFKLYARDIIRQPLRADLVTISTCSSAGARAYSGEGLVGLSWAFLRAGAHNVVGALWDASDDSTPQLMDAFYGELQKGKSPSAALRTAKLGLLHSDTAAFRKPFYWAPFQLYTGS